ncbi:MAG: hypothetical protein RL660_54 [Bacteroidota bacterium]
MSNLFSCIVPVCAGYTDPSHQAEQSTQLLFGEIVTVLQEQGAWLQVQNVKDAYVYWVLRAHICNGADATGQLATADVLTSTGMTIPIGADIGNTMAWQNATLGSLIEKPSVAHNFSVPQLIQLAHAYLGASYLWGGRTKAGIDCSGFINIIYKQAGIYLPHDARLQAVQGDTIDFLEAAMPGDIAFFDNNDGHITHVGLMLNSAQIIHSSEVNGGVDVDFMDVQGIVNSKSKEHTHKLRIIKRYITAQNQA